MTFNIRQKVFDKDADYLEESAINCQDQLMKLFAASPEGQGLLNEGHDLGWASMMLEFGISYIGVTPPQMSPTNLEEIVFEIFPRKVSAPPEEAGEAILQLQAFWRFLQSKFGLKNAEACLKVVADKAIPRLEKEMGDPANFGIAKSMVMMGLERGFDISTLEGMQAWTDTYDNEIKAGTGLPIPLPGEKSKSARTVHQKIKRQMARESQRRNRKKK